MEPKQFWPACLTRLEGELSKQQFNTWIRPLNAETSGEGIVLLAPNRFILQFIKERFWGRIEELADEMLDGSELPLELKVGKPVTAHMFIGNSSLFANIPARLGGSKLGFAFIKLQIAVLAQSPAQPCPVD